MDFQVLLRRYATLIARRGLNVQKNQDVFIGGETIHRELALLVAAECYRLGARFVGIDLNEPRAAKLRIEMSAEENLSYVPRYFTTKYEDMVDNRSANLYILGQENPDLLSTLDPQKINTTAISRRRALKKYYDEGVEKSKVQWCLAAAATPGWALQVFSHLDDTLATEKLWEDIFKICRVDSEDYLERYAANNKAIKHRASILNNLAIKELHFIGPETDLVVGLSTQSIFRGGASETDAGIAFEPNIPSEEVFTTPDWRITNGKVKVTRPVMVNGKYIVGLKLEFKEGEIVSFSAEEGEAMFAEYIKSDIGSKRLGEVALVGMDSPIFQTGRVYREILFDENAACHIAIGSAYKYCIKGGEAMSKDELSKLGVNDSIVHTDFMISSSEVSVEAITKEGKKVQIITSGKWEI